MFTKIQEKKKNVIFINFSNFLFLRKQRDVLSDGIIEKNKVTNSRLSDEIDHKWGQIFVIFQQLH